VGNKEDRGHGGAKRTGDMVVNGRENKKGRERRKRVRSEGIKKVVDC
jgi:hypothetical protein